MRRKDPQDKRARFALDRTQWSSLRRFSVCNIKVTHPKVDFVTAGAKAEADATTAARKKAVFMVSTNMKDCG
jgi:hypothetical protein